MPNTPQPEYPQLGTPLRQALEAGLEAFDRGQVDEGDAAYRRAVDLARADGLDLWSILAVDHVTQLSNQGTFSRALRCCEEYCGSAGADDAGLLLLHAELRVFIGDFGGAYAVLSKMDAAPEERGASDPEEDARLHRIRGLIAADRSDAAAATHHLTEARRLFLAIGLHGGVQVVNRDLEVLAVRQGRPEAVASAASSESSGSVGDRQRRALGLRQQQRYEEALGELRQLDGPDLDPALRLPVRYQIALLLLLTRQYQALDRYVPDLGEAATTSPSPQAVADARWLADPYSPVEPTTGDGGQAVEAATADIGRAIPRARRLVADHRLDEALCLIRSLRGRVGRTGEHLAAWHLAAGEWFLARDCGAGDPDLLRSAAGHCRSAAAHAAAASLVEIRVLALRLLGNALFALHRSDQATACWARAHRCEERIASCQVTDRIRVQMLQQVADEHDELVNAAARAQDTHGWVATAGVAVAMEWARDAAILDGIAPVAGAALRKRPEPDDHEAAWRWVSGLADRLPPAQVVWMMHATPTHVHHMLIGPRMTRHLSVPVSRKDLYESLEGLRCCWANDIFLMASIRDGTFREGLRTVTRQVGVEQVLSLLPRWVRRVAVVAGGELSDIPFAAAATEGDGRPLGLRYAMSDLPCLSAGRALHATSGRARGDRLLLVSPPDDALTQRAGHRAQIHLEGEEATKEGLRSALRSFHDGIVKIDSHGSFNHADGTEPWVQLMPQGPEGRLTADELQTMDLRGCGTLILGACESGMTRMIGREHRMGFVRAALHAGAASVVVARWVAVDAVSAAVLDRFVEYIRYLPRDLALQRAQREVYQHAAGAATATPWSSHPAIWGCWTLYGDCGWQTHAGRFRRTVRRGYAAMRGISMDWKRKRKPQVFVSFAWANQTMAHRIGEDLSRRGIDVFIDSQAIDPGQNVVATISKALGRSDYCVLLWSEACDGRTWIEMEWSAALHREVRERRSFLFVVRLDTAPLPDLLAPRRYLDAFGNYDQALDDLVEAWRRDASMEVPVLPAPCPAQANGQGDTAVVYIRNQALKVAHTLAVPGRVTGSELDRLVRRRLQLPDTRTEFEGQIGLRFHYQLIHHNAPIPIDAGVAPDIADGSIIDLKVLVEPFGPDHPSETGMVFLPGATDRMPQTVIRAMTKAAFRHLAPE
ncbi:MAG: CHAT domain-containing protein [Micromonosporaceae bacterium]|nr:CHAT domain-containing protein [Micromonosporaceae bacterium]